MFDVLIKTDEGFLRQAEVTILPGPSPQPPAR
jgi:hypothetical protein